MAANTVRLVNDLFSKLYKKSHTCFSTFMTGSSIPYNSSYCSNYSLLAGTTLIGGLCFFVIRRLFSRRRAQFEVNKTPISLNGRHKMVILVRTDLDMTKGKAMSQACHATLEAYRTTLTRISETESKKVNKDVANNNKDSLHDYKRWLIKWEQDGQPKVTLRVDDNATLQDSVKKARKLGLVAELISDAGRTQLISGTQTVAAIGPAPEELIDQVTGHFKLY